MNKIFCKSARPGQLTPGLQDKMYNLYHDFYPQVDRASFIREVMQMKHVLLAFDKKTFNLAGFASDGLEIVKAEYNDRSALRFAAKIQELKDLLTPVSLKNILKF